MKAKDVSIGGEYFMHSVVGIELVKVLLHDPVMGLYFGFRSLHNQGVDKKIKKLVKEG